MFDGYWYVWLYAGMVIGTVFGYGIACLMFAAKEGDKRGTGGKTDGLEKR